MWLREGSTTVAVVFGSTVTAAPRSTTASCSAYFVRNVLNTVEPHSSCSTYFVEERA